MFQAVHLQVAQTTLHYAHNADNFVYLLINSMIAIRPSQLLDNNNIQKLSVSNLKN